MLCCLKILTAILVNIKNLWCFKVIILFEYTCCFIGHRKINKTDELKSRLNEIIEKLIVFENVHTFLFGSKSQFNDLCYEVVSDIKIKYPNIKRTFVRAEYPEINDEYKKYILSSFEHTYFPDVVKGSGKAAYIKRNFEMIKSSYYCIVYYDEKYNPISRKSGTKLAFEYATKLKKKIINVID